MFKRTNLMFRRMKFMVGRTELIFGRIEWMLRSIELMFRRTRSSFISVLYMTFYCQERLVRYPLDRIGDLMNLRDKVIIMP